jgi:peptidoglycan/LPS O-acetylase OafA/YrhL
MVPSICSIFREEFLFIKTEFRKDIQVLRGLAVLAVVLFHTNEWNFPHGYLGVDVFFVISGFVVTPLILRIFTDKIHGKKLYNLRHFYKRRFYRLAPALTATLVISAILIFLFGPVLDHQRFARQGVATLVLLGNVGAYRYSGDYFSPNPNPLVHTWSLSVEEQIYLILPLVLMLIINNRRSIQKTSVVVLGIVSAVSFVSFLDPVILEPLYSRVGIKPTSEFSFYSPLDRIWQFTVGGLAFLSMDRYQERTRRIPRGLNLLMAITIILVLFSPIHTTLKTSSMLASSSALFVIIFGSLNALPNFLISKLAWVGDRSYSIYLVHMPVLYLAKYSPVTLIGIDENRNIQVIIAVFASILLGALSYSNLENRYRNGFRDDHSSRKKIAIPLVITLLVPVLVFVSLDRSTAIALKNSGIPVPSEIPPWDWDKECKFFSSPQNKNPKPCKYGNHRSGLSILLIGDSHAASISRAIISLGNSNNMDTFIFTFSGCSFLLNNKDFNSSYSYPLLTPDCIEHNQMILNFVRINKPTVIIYAYRSSSKYVYPNNSVARTQYNVMVLKNLKVLMKEDIKAIQIGSVPEVIPTETRVEDWLDRKAKFSNIPNEDNNFWENNFPSDYYLDTLNIFCPRGVCANKSNKGWLFQDSNHLSELGARSLIGELDPLIKEILSNKR